MHVQIVEFELQGMSRGDYERRCEQVAETFAGLPGLLAKVWVIDPESNRAGGVYTWIDRAAREAYEASELFAAVRGDPSLANVRSRHFDVLERPTETTRGLSVPVAA